MPNLDDLKPNQGRFPLDDGYILIETQDIFQDGSIKIIVISDPFMSNLPKVEVELILTVEEKSKFFSRIDIQCSIYQVMNVLKSIGVYYEP